MNKIMRHYIHKYMHIAGYTLLCQLVIHGVQWPILMAWGYAQHPLSIVGNVIFTPFICALIAICTIICISNVCGVIWPPLYQCVDMIVRSWLSLFTIPIHHIHLQFATPHWTILVAIPVITGSIVWYIRGIWRANATLVCAFITIGYSLTLTTPQPHTHLINNNIMLSQVGKHIVVVQMHEPRSARYTHNWITYHMIPTLRQQYGTDTIDCIVTRKKQSRLVTAVRNSVNNACHHILLSDVMRACFQSCHRNKTPEQSDNHSIM